MNMLEIRGPGHVRFVSLAENTIRSECGRESSTRFFAESHFTNNTTLTTRQREILQLVAEGHHVKEIGEILFISRRTVEFHKYKMMETLGLKSNAELLQYAIKHHVV